MEYSAQTDRIFMFIRPLLVIDLDETILCCRDTPPCAHAIPTAMGHVIPRPGLGHFLDKVSQHYDMMIWSRNGTEYIHLMLETVWPKHIQLIDVFDQSHCSRLVRDGMSEPMFKDMKKVAKKHKQYEIRRMIGIDDLPLAYKRNYGNLVKVTAYKGGPDDELQRLSEFLIELSKHEDMRKVEKRYWRKPSHQPDFSAQPV